MQIRRALAALRWLDPLAHLEVALNRRLVRRTEHYARDAEPGSEDEANWIITAEGIRAASDKLLPRRERDTS
jgi:hypothetical protein